MNTTSKASSTHPAVQVVLSDSAGSAAVIDSAAALAHAQARDLSLVYVESTLALQAAALPLTQALAHMGAAWLSFAPQDVEQGWRAQARRLRALAGAIAPRHAVAWSFCSVRGALPQVAVELSGVSDLLLVDSGAALHAPAWRARAESVTWVRSESDADGGGKQVAAQLAQALHAPLRTLLAQSTDENALDDLLRSARAAQTWVLPRSRATAKRLAAMPCPVLLVG